MRTTSYLGFVLLFFFTFFSSIAAFPKTDLPPMGFNTWNAFGCDISEDLINQQLDVFSYLSQFGYSHFVLDDCVFTGREKTTGKLILDTEKFPSGLVALNNKIKSVSNNAASLGVYSCYGRQTCQKRPGSYGHYDVDAKYFIEELGVSYIKMDWCNSKGLNMQKVMSDFAAAVESTKGYESVTIEACTWGLDNVQTFAMKYADMWRISRDIKCSWSSFMHNLHAMAGKHKYSGGGKGYNYPDMLEISCSGMDFFEQRTQFSAFAAVGSPLVIGADLRKLGKNKELLDVVTNTHALALNQDPSPQGYRMYKDLVDEREIWARRLSNGDFAVVIFTTMWDYHMDFDIADLGLKKAKVYDIWNDRTFFLDKTIRLELNRHDCFLFRVTPIE
ncbi:hypothetical protein PCE1_003815 [Barthelona sp. PCE]